MNYTNFVHIPHKGQIDVFPIDMSNQEDDRFPTIHPQDRLADHSFVMDELRKVAGRVLTVIDAVIPSQPQNKAVKDMIRGIIVDEYEFIANILLDQEAIQEEANASYEEAFKNGDIIEDVSLEDVIGA